MRKNVEQAMDALFAGKDKRSSTSVFTEQRGEFVIDVAPSPDEVWPSHHTMEMRGSGRYLPTVYSYGHHFPMVLLDGDTAYVNTAKYSMTTAHHKSSARQYLAYKGFRDTGMEQLWPQLGKFAIYRRNGGVV